MRSATYTARRATSKASSVILSLPAPDMSFAFSHTTRATECVSLARILWLEGFPDQAMRAAQRSIADARATNRATFGKHVAMMLSADDWRQLWVPVGFAHGYCTLEDDTEVQYKVTDYYSPPHERGIVWNDPALAIEWPIRAEAITTSERDRRLPRLAEQCDLFEYGG